LCVTNAGLVAGMQEGDLMYYSWLVSTNGNTWYHVIGFLWSNV